MSGVWMPWLAAVAMAIAGALAATVFWWWLAPVLLAVRWSKPLRNFLEEGFAEQALERRLSSQADKIWARRQQAQWRENQEAMLAHHEARLLAHIRRMSRPLATTLAAPKPAAFSASAASATSQPEAAPTVAALTDAQIDAMPADLPPATRRRVMPAGKPPLSSV